MLLFELTSSFYKGPVNPPRGKIESSVKIEKFIKELSPLASRYLAIKDWGESPWKISLIVSEAALCLERNSSDEQKKKIAEQTMNGINERITTAKNLYEKVCKENGGETDVSLKLKDDISFMETMHNIIDAQVNGLVSHQKSWKERSKEISDRCSEQTNIKSTWDNIRSKFPWVAGTIGVIVGGAVWGADGWHAMTELMQYASKQGHGSQLVSQYIKPMVDIAFGVAATVGLGAFLHKISQTRFMQNLYKHIKKNQEAVKENASWIGAAVGMAAGFALFATGQLDGAINLVREIWRSAHTDPNMVKYIDPIVKFFWNIGGMVFLGWFFNKMDRLRFAKKEAIKDKYEAKQIDIVAEEKLFRKATIQLIKEKAIELHAKYGYCTELDIEAPGIVTLVEARNFTEINKMHKTRMDEIFAQFEKVPEELMAGALS